jgi:hypothetical protein
MLPELLRTHCALDTAVDRLYQPAAFVDHRARVEHLFRLYEVMVHPVSAAPAANKRTARRVAKKALDTGSTPIIEQ